MTGADLAWPATLSQALQTSGGAEACHKSGDEGRYGLLAYLLVLAFLVVAVVAGAIGCFLGAWCTKGGGEREQRRPLPQPAPEPQRLIRPGRREVMTMTVHTYARHHATPRFHPQGHDQAHGAWPQRWLAPDGEEM